MEVAELVIAGTLALWEVVSRVVPTNKTWSIIGTIINLFKKTSESLDTKKKRSRKVKK